MPTEILTPTTELEAINAILASIGEAPVNEITDAFVDAQLAQNLLRQESRAAQSTGFIFNTDPEVVLTPDGSGHIWLPANTLKVIQADRTITRRGQRLYTTTTRSYVFTTSVTAALVLALNFDELPEVLRRYLYVRAARTFQARMGPERVVYEISSQDVLKATADWMNAEAEEGNYNAFSSSALLLRIKGSR